MPGLKPARFCFHAYFQNRYASTPRHSRIPSWLQAAGSAAALSLAVLTPCRADSALTLELPPSAEAVAQRAAERARQAAARIPDTPPPMLTGATRPSSNPALAAGRSRSYYPSRGGSVSTERVVGRLGQVERNTTIYRSQSARTAHLSTAPAGTYLAIQSEGNGWYGILMSDGSLGWLRRQNVKLLDYQVVSNGQLPTPPSNSIPDNYSDGLPASRAAFFLGDPQALFNEAYKYMGVPYHWGGNSASGIDCSAFVQKVFMACGYQLPRHSSDQTAYGLPVPKDQLQPGDRLYFGNAATRNITHTGLYLGNGYFIHASSNQHGVAISQITDSLYERMYICARR